MGCRNSRIPSRKTYTASIVSEEVTKRWVYCASRDAKGHKGRRSAYLVEQQAGSNVIARITPIGLVKEITQQQEINIFALRNGMTVAGRWSESDSKKHQRSRVVLGKYDQ